MHHDEAVIVEYEFEASTGDPRATAEFVALEQTLEVPRSIVDEHGLGGWVGEIAELRPSSPETDGRARARVRYRAELTHHSVIPLLNLLIGNVSIVRGVRIVDLELPESFLASFRGPRSGIEGIRAKLAVPRRPLLATALKPRGASDETLARVAGEFARGGGDLIKDDHNLADRSVSAFRERISRVRDAVRANGSTLYCAHFAPRREEFEAALTAVEEEEIDGLLVEPFLLGLDTTRWLAERFSGIVLAHPAATGSLYVNPGQGIDVGVLLGTLFRLCGVDGSVFPHAGGRFDLSEAECSSIADRLRRPLAQIAPAWPLPAGGMQYERIGELVEFYGRDAMLLIGGALLRDDAPLAKSTERFREAIERATR